MDKVGLLSLATALPPYSVEQSVAKAKAREVFGGKKELFDRLASVFDNAGIARRHIVAPTEWYEGHHGWKERNRVYLDACDALFRDAARAAIDRAGLKPSDIDGVVAVSTTGIATPSLDARNGPAIGLRGDVRRVPIFGMGCAGGVNGIATAARLAAGDPGSRWLYVTIETCSIAIRLDSDDPAAIVATAIFGDGAAAAVVGTDGEGIATIAGAGEKMWPDTLNIMGWRVEDPGLAVVFDRAIPPFVETELANAVDEMVADMGRSRGEIDRFCCHPGGVKVIDAIESALDLPVGTLDLERDVLNDCGNMSAPTVLFVLDRLIARGLPERTMLTSFGPGFTCAGMLLGAGMIWEGIAVLAFVTLQRLAELALSQRNTRRLLARGAYEVAPGHYPFLVLLHATWLAVLWFFGPGPPIEIVPLILYALLQLGRVWVIATLGERWTTRIIILPDAPLVKTGPYRWFKHPNYMIVIGEFAVLPLVFDLPVVAIVFSVLNGLLLWVRISDENRALGR